jgi:methylphosphotriester-DNA--protein-cysteine methyltransferase
MLDFAAQYAAFQQRDPALDGVVFVAVKTTGVYCRPVCRARTPLARNIHFYPSAQQQRNVLATAPASIAALKQLRSVQRGKAPRQLSSEP